MLLKEDWMMEVKVLSCHLPSSCSVWVSIISDTAGTVLWTVILGLHTVSFQLLRGKHQIR